MDTVKDIREKFASMLTADGLDEKGMLEIMSCRFIADEPAVFGTPDEDWHRRELDWYLRQSLNINSIEPPIPSVWQQVSGENGEINSNYGWCVLSEQNGCQFDKAIQALMKDPYSRQAVMIYTRPSMHEDFNRAGAYDFICTNNTQLLIRDNKLHYLVYMRSSDAILGYKGDLAWHKFTHSLALGRLLNAGVVPDLRMGDIIWNAGSFHIYPRHVRLVEEWIGGRS